jgi:transmembrane sensor
MMYHPQHREDTQRISERAAQWLCILEDGGEAESAAFAEWITESPQHLREFLLMSALNSEISGIDARRQIDIQAILARATHTVIPIGEANRRSSAKRNVDSTARPNRSVPLPRRRFAAIAASIAASALLATVLWHHWQGNNYQTAIGEQRTVELADGSVMQLNTRSEARVQLSKTARDIRLVDGEAMFKVAQDRNRPFRVRVGDNVIQAVGTQFNVNRRPSGTTLSVLEGAVKIIGEQGTPMILPRPATSDIGHALSQTMLVAGEEVRIGRDGRIERFTRIDPLRASSWRQHRLVFRDDTLEDIAAEFNRYNRHFQIILEGADVRQRRYTAVFDTDDAASLMEFLRQDEGLLFEEKNDELIVKQN